MMFKGRLLPVPILTVIRPFFAIPGHYSILLVFNWENALLVKSNYFLE